MILGKILLQDDRFKNPLANSSKSINSPNVRLVVCKHGEVKVEIKTNEPYNEDSKLWEYDFFYSFHYCIKQTILSSPILSYEDPNL